MERKYMYIIVSVASGVLVVIVLLTLLILKYRHRTGCCRIQTNDPNDVVSQDTESLAKQVDVAKLNRETHVIDNMSITEDCASTFKPEVRESSEEVSEACLSKEGPIKLQENFNGIAIAPSCKPQSSNNDICIIKSNGQDKRLIYKMNPKDHENVLEDNKCGDKIAENLHQNKANEACVLEKRDETKNCISEISNEVADGARKRPLAPPKQRVKRKTAKEQQPSEDPEYLTPINVKCVSASTNCYDEVQLQECSEVSLNDSQNFTVENSVNVESKLTYSNNAVPIQNQDKVSMKEQKLKEFKECKIYENAKAGINKDADDESKNDEVSDYDLLRKTGTENDCEHIYSGLEYGDR